MAPWLGQSSPNRLSLDPMSYLSLSTSAWRRAKNTCMICSPAYNVYACLMILSFPFYVSEHRRAE